MRTGKILVSLFAVFALVFLMSGVSAFGNIVELEVNGVDALPGDSIAVMAGQNLPVKLVFSSNGDASDAVVKAWITGEEGASVTSERFDVIADNLYSGVINVRVPNNIGLSESLTLEVRVESRNDGVADSKTASLTGQRESYALDILDVSVHPDVQAGKNLIADVVVKNQGRHLAGEVYLKVRMPDFGIEKKVYIGDISPVDQVEESSIEKRVYVRIPSDAEVSVYLIEVEAYNEDSVITTSRNFAVEGVSLDTKVTSEEDSRIVSSGKTAEYSFVLVNDGERTRAYEFESETPEGLILDFEPYVVVQAGESKTVEFKAIAEENGEYEFTVKVMSGEELVEELDFKAQIEGKGFVGKGNTTILLTVVLAIIFIVLLVVLIALLTRKPDNTEEFVESYY
jgi:hypothetical protein